MTALRIRCTRVALAAGLVAAAALLVARAAPAEDSAAPADEVAVPATDVTAPSKAGDAPAGDAAPPKEEPSGRRQRKAAAGKAEQPGGEAASAGPTHGKQQEASDGTLIVFDDVKHVYLVPRHKFHYWSEEKFYRYEAGLWLKATALAGPWRLAAQTDIPPAIAHLHETRRGATIAKLPSGGEAVFDAKLKAHRVSGKDGILVVGDRFLRFDSGLWLYADSEAGPWSLAEERKLPLALRKGMPRVDDGKSVTLPSGEVVVYDAKTAVFVLRDKPGTLLYDGSFFERRGNQWFAAAQTPANFTPVDGAKVPQPVRARFFQSAKPAKKPAAEAPAAAAPDGANEAPAQPE